MRSLWQLNIANPSTGGQKLIDIDDDKKLRSLYDKRLAAEIDGEDIGDEFKGYVFKILGGQDKQGFSMHQGVLTTDRVRLMMRKGARSASSTRRALLLRAAASCCQPSPPHGAWPRAQRQLAAAVPATRTGLTPPRPLCVCSGDQGCRGYGMRKGERYRKSVRGCIISHNTSVLHLVIVKKGPEELPGLTDSLIPRRLGPKRASKIRKLFALTKDDDVRKYVIRREVPAKSEDKKPSSKAPKIQRLVTPISLQRKRHRMSEKKNRQLKAKTEAAEYQKLLAQRQKESREKRNEKLSQRKSQRSSKAED